MVFLAQALKFLQFKWQIEKKKEPVQNIFGYVCIECNMQCLCLMSQEIPRGIRNSSTLKDLIMQ